MFPVTENTISTLRGRQHWMADLFEIVRRDGERRFFCSSDGKVDFDGAIYYPTAAERMDEEFQAGPGAGDTMLRGVVTPWRHGISSSDIDNRKYDDALVIVRRVDRRRAKLCNEKHFFVENMEQDGPYYAAELLSLARELRTNRGPAMNNTCPAILGDQLCQASVPEHTVTVTSVDDAQFQFRHSGHSPTPDPNFYGLGEVKWLTGNNRGNTSRVWASNDTPSVHIVQLAAPTRRHIVVGDTAILKPGCDGLATTCKTRFANLANYRGNQFARNTKELILARGTVN